MRRREAIGGLAAGAAALWIRGGAVSLAAAASRESGALALVRQGRPLPLYVDAQDFPAVLRAARGLQADLGRLSGQPAELFTTQLPQAPALIIAGTLGRSPVIDGLVRDGKLEVSSVAGEWEAFVRQGVQNPVPGVDRALIVAGADKRGTVFGLYDLAARMGVSPWAWWADVPVLQTRDVYVSPERFTDKPAVRYRGIFLNDEEPALGNWTRRTFGGFNHAFYERVYELILRLKGNFLWPAMWGKAIYDDDPVSPALADEMGVVLGTSHHEPMMRAHVEWERHGSGPWDYTQNEARLRAFWREGVTRMGHNESLVTIGMRGDGDKPMTQGVAIPLLERIVRDQRQIIAEVTGQDAARTPQVWALYKEVQEYYDQGMTVPDDVTLLLSDDNWGNLRRLPRPGQQRQGGYGIYYHFDYVGGPRSYKWLNTSQIERTWEQMRRAYESGVDRIWVVNVGDLKPMEFPISAFLEQAWNPQGFTLEHLRDYPRAWAAQQFGERHAQEIGELLRRYTQLNARRKPELLAPDTYSLVHYREAERVVADYNALAARALKLRDDLPIAHRHAYFQLVLFPIQVCANLTELHVTAGRNRLYADQGRAATNAAAARVKTLFERDAELTRQYHEDIAGGKWNQMMCQSHIGYTSWNDPPRNIMPEVRTLDMPAAAGLGVAIEGSAHAWPGGEEEAVLPELTPFIGEGSRYIDVFNRGTAAYRFEASSPQPWLRVSPASGQVGAETRLVVSADWRSVPPGEHRVPIVIRGAGGAVKVIAHVVRPPSTHDVRGYVEANGYVAMEAAHYSRAVPETGVWMEVPALGRTHSGVTVFLPAAAAAQPLGTDSQSLAAAPHLQYNVYLFSSGEARVEVTLAPTLNYTGGEGMRYAVALDDEAPRIVNVHAGDNEKLWGAWVSANSNVQSTRHSVASPGRHTLKLWAIDPALVFQRVVVAMRDLRPSYLGPPESIKV